VPAQEIKDEIKSITVSKQNSMASMNQYLDTFKSPNNLSSHSHNHNDIPTFNSSFNDS